MGQWRVAGSCRAPGPKEVSLQPWFRCRVSYVSHCLAIFLFPRPGRWTGASVHFPTLHLFRAQAQPTGTVPPLLLAVWEHSGPHHTFTFTALVLRFQPDASLGYCWPFQGSQTEVLIQLPAQIQPTAITVQHTSKTASPLGTASSAPRDFTVSVSLCWALGAGTWLQGKERRNGDLLLSAHLPRYVDLCAAKYCCSLRQTLQGTCGVASPLLRLA